MRDNVVVSHAPSASPDSGGEPVSRSVTRRLRNRYRFSWTPGNSPSSFAFTAHPLQSSRPPPARGRLHGPGVLESADPAGTELHADPRPAGPGRPGHGVLPGALAAAAQDQQAAIPDLLPQPGAPPRGRSRNARAVPSDTMAAMVSPVFPRPAVSPSHATLSRPSRHRHNPAVRNSSPSSAVARVQRPVPAQRMEQGHGNQRERGDRDRSREAGNLHHQLEQGRADGADHDRSGRVVHCPLNHSARLGAHAGYAGQQPCRSRVVLDDDGSHFASPGYRYDQLRTACPAARRLPVTWLTPLLPASRHGYGPRRPPERRVLPGRSTHSQA
jgi:hypothetical protein